MIKLIQNWNATMEWLAVHEPRILEIVPQELPCNRKEGILLSRYLILKLFGNFIQVDYNDYKKPFLVGRSENISISHTKGAAALWVSPTLNGAVDIQIMKLKINQLYPYFLNQWQQEEIIKIKDLYFRTLLLTRLWTIKEVCIKYSEEKYLGFKNNIIIPTIASLTAKNILKMDAVIRGKCATKILSMSSFCDDKYVITFTIK